MKTNAKEILQRPRNSAPTVKLDPLTQSQIDFSKGVSWKRMNFRLRKLQALAQNAETEDENLAILKKYEHELFLSREEHRQVTTKRYRKTQVQRIFDKAGGASKLHRMIVRHVDPNFKYVTVWAWKAHKTGIFSHHAMKIICDAFMHEGIYLSSAELDPRPSPEDDHEVKRFKE
jgi:hypothetical protein